MLAIRRCDDWLGKGSIEQPAFPYPPGAKSGGDSLEIWHKLLNDLFLAQLEERSIHRAIVAEIDEVAPAILRGRAEVGMFNQTGEKIARVTGVDPIAIGELAVQRKYETLRPIVLPPIITRAVIAGQLGYEATDDASCQGRDDAGERPCRLAGVKVARA